MYCQHVGGYLAGEVHDVLVFTFGGDGARSRSVVAGVTVWRLANWTRRRHMPLRAAVEFTRRYRSDARYLNPLEIRYAVAAAVRQEGRFDVLEVPEYQGLGSLLDAAATDRLALRLHGAASLTKPPQWPNPWAGIADPERASALSADVVTAPTQSALERCEVAWRIELPGARVIPNPIPWNPRVPVARTGFDILFVGRLEYGKGIDILSDALALLPPGIRIAAAGRDSPFPEGGTGGERLLEATQGRVELLDSLPHDELKDVVRRSRVVVVPSRWESFGSVVAEAMMWGTPVVASDIAPFREITGHGKAAVLFESGSPASLARAILRVLGDEAMAERLADAAYDHVQRFRLETVVPQLLDAWGVVE